MQTRDIVRAAEALVPEMKEAGADLVFALAYSGIGAARHSNEDGECRPVARPASPQG